MQEKFVKRKIIRPSSLSRDLCQNKIDPSGRFNIRESEGKASWDYQSSPTPFKESWQIVVRLLVPTNPFPQSPLIITLFEEIAGRSSRPCDLRRGGSGACNGRAYVHIVWGQRTLETCQSLVRRTGDSARQRLIIIEGGEWRRTGCVARCRSFTCVLVIARRAIAL